MEKFGKSQPIKRVEDVRFLNGTGRYVDDIVPSGALRAYVLRSTVAHGDITTLDIADARAADGVHMVLTLADLEAAGLNVAMNADIITNSDGTRAAAPERPILARGRVRFVGEPVAFIVADTLAQARDAAEMIELDFDDLDVHMALAAGGPALHAEAPDNVAFDWSMGDIASVDAVLASAAHVINVPVQDNRIIVNSMEPRGCFAQPEGARLHVSVNGQGVWSPRASIAQVLRMDATDVRVTNPDVGGGFGMKAMDYPETFLCAYAARTLGRAIAWMSDRSEAMQSDNAGRDLVSTATLGFDVNHRLIAYKVDTIANLGAYNSQAGQLIQTAFFSKVLPGVYDVQAVAMRTVGVYTNTTQVDAYRGAGRPEAIYVLERSLDHAAREMGVDPWALRQRNFIKPNQFPYLSATGQPYDVGDFERVLARVTSAADRDGFAQRRAVSAAAGKLRGIGLCYYIESILGDPSETSRVDFNTDGTVSIFVGTQSNGQGHETVFAQFLADQTGIPADRISVVQGDSDLIPTGGGTGGSRSVTVQNTATLAAVGVLIDGFSAFLGEVEGVPAMDVSFDDERFRIAGSNLTPTMLDVADMARGAGRDDLLSVSKQIKLDHRSYPNGAHVSEVEIDPQTGVVTVQRYTIIDDFGNLINPMLVEGQVHGGVVQGIGQTLFERVVYDEDGQLLTASFMDYAMARAEDVPMMYFDTEATQSLYNPMGMKGCGEAGTVGALAAITNAVQDAVWDLGVRDVQMPFTPHRVWQMLNRGGDASP
jgi:carbon-monoxide dehydrogenase large subunit